MKFNTLLTTLKTFSGKRGPEILIGMGIASFILTAVLAVKETPEAICLKQEIREEDREPTLKETVLINAKAYWPAVITGTFSVFCIVGGHHIQFKRTAAATAAYFIAHDSLQNITDKLTEDYGKKKLTEIKDRIAHDKMEKHPFNENYVIRTSNGDTLCFDAISGRYFYTSIDAVRKAENEMNKRMLRDTFISLNEFYLELDLDPIKFGDDVGWDTDLDGPVNIEYSSQLDNQGVPCLVIDSYNLSLHCR